MSPRARSCRCTQDEVEWRGHAIECRINAEDHEHGFRPSPGKITYWYKPGGPGMRVDSHVYAGYTVPPYYDSMIGKLIAYGKDRPEALRRMEIALEEMIVEGIKTTIPFHHLALRDPRFQAGDIDTHFVEHLLKPKAEPAPAAANESANAEAATVASAVPRAGPGGAERVRVRVAATPGQADVDAHDAAVVIDVLRATTTLTYAFARGARAVIPVASPAEADAVRRRATRARCSCGERDGLRVAGLRSRQLARRVHGGGGGGTHADLRLDQRLAGDDRFAPRAARASSAPFVNARAVVDVIAGEDEVALVCAGKLGQPSLEDLACAGWLCRIARGARRADRGAAARLGPRAGPGRRRRDHGAGPGQLARPLPARARSGVRPRRGDLRRARRPRPRRRVVTRDTSGAGPGSARRSRRCRRRCHRARPRGRAIARRCARAPGRCA